MKTARDFIEYTIPITFKWDNNLDNIPIDIVIDLMKRYAQQVAEDIRQRCYDNAVCFFAFEDQEPEVSEGSILRTEIILP